MDNEINNILSKPLDEIGLEEVKNICEYILVQNGLAADDWAKHILEVADIVKYKYGIEKSVRFLVEAYEKYSLMCYKFFENKASILRKCCYLCIEDSNLYTAHKIMNMYVYNALTQIHHQAYNSKMRYFCFRGFSSYSLADINEQKITLTHPRMFNDPLDTLLFWWLNSELKKNNNNKNDETFLLLLKKVSEHIKIRCFIGSLSEKGNKTICVEDLSILMWSHYADSHKGFCIEYEFDREMFNTHLRGNRDTVVFIDKITYSSSIDMKNNPSMQRSLLEKSNFWEYENEMRLVLFDPNDECIEFPSIPCTNAIKAVYLGTRCSDINRRQMEIAIGSKDIPLFQMSIDEDNLTRLKKTRIG